MEATTMSRFPFYKQHDSMLCGITCLQIICQYFGKKYLLEDILRYCFATMEGISLLGISEAAGQLGLHTLCGRTTLKLIRQAPLPCILHWNQNHFVVLYKIKGKGERTKFYVADPGKGLIKYSFKEFKEHWISTISQGEEKGVAMFLQPTPAFYEKEGDSKKQKKSFTFLFSYFKQYRRYFGQIVLGLLIGSGKSARFRR